MTHMETKVAARLGLIAIAILVFALGVVFRFKHPDLPFARVGGFLGLIAVIALLFRDGMRSYGVPTSGQDTWGRKLARNLEPLMLAFFLPLTVISAWYQTIDFPDTTISADNGQPVDPDSIIRKYESWFGDEVRIDGEGLLLHLKQAMASNKARDARVGELWFPELLILNCGAEKVCDCANKGYRQVEYRETTDGNWNLNAGIRGASTVVSSDSVNLCWRPSKYGALAQGGEPAAP